MELGFILKQPKYHALYCYTTATYSVDTHTTYPAI